jgi:hypothetical protein
VAAAAAVVAALVEVLVLAVARERLREQHPVVPGVAAVEEAEVAAVEAELRQLPQHPRTFSARSRTSCTSQI